MPHRLSPHQYRETARSLCSGDYQGELESFEASLAAYRELDDDFNVARALHRIGFAYSQVGSIIEFHELTRQSLDLARAAGSEYDTAKCLGNLAWAAFYLGDYAEGENYMRAGIAIAQHLGSRGELAVHLMSQNWLHLLRGDRTRARHMGEEIAKAFAAVGDSVNLGAALPFLALVAIIEGDYSAGQQFAEQVRSLRCQPDDLWLANLTTAIAAWEMMQPHAVTSGKCLRKLFSVTTCCRA